MAADTLFSVLALSGAATAVTDGMYLGAYLLLGASGLHPSMAGLSEPARRVRGPRLGRGRLLAMGAAALVAPALLVLQRLQGVELQVATVTAAWAVLFVLVMARMAGLVRVIERAEAERRGCSTGRSGRPRRSGCASPPSCTTGPSSAWPSSPTTWTAASTASWRRSSTGVTQEALLDDGVGFEPRPTSALVRDGHFGLVAMRERVEMAGGRFQVDTHPGAGVRVRAMR